MVDTLVQEEIKLEDDQTGACMEYMLKHGVLNILVNISESDFPLGIRGETIRFVSTLVNLLDVKFLIHSPIHIPTLKLLKLCIKEDTDNQMDKFNNFYVDDLIDLLYTLCSKIHSSPPLLNIFFYDKKWLTTPQKQGSPLNKEEIANLTGEYTNDEDIKPKIILNENDSPQYECLLFSYLLRFVHREGKSGDYARTGLLFLIEVAGGNFRDYILYHSDLCPILSAGLGALYSQLPRKLLVKYVDEDRIQFKLTRSKELNDEDGLDDFQVSSSPQFKILIDSFLKTLEFCQDILQRCPSRAICMALLSDIKSVFLESILYHSMMESSDLDGSAVAVISYIEIILSTLKDGELVDLFIRFLINSEEEDILHKDKMTNSETSSIKSFNSNKEERARRNTETNSILSENSIREMKANKNKAHLAFNLKDLLFNNLQSKSIPTSISALKLLNTIINGHAQYLLLLLGQENCLPVTLPPTSRVLSPTIPTFEEAEKEKIHHFKQKPYTTISNHHQEIQSYFLLINNMDPRFNKDGFIPGYEPYIKQVESMYNNYKLQENDYSLQQHHLKRNEPILQILLELLSNFFNNPCELNLVLSNVLFGLACCPYIKLDELVCFQLNLIKYKQSKQKLSPAQTKFKKEKSSGLSITIDTNITKEDSEEEEEVYEVNPLEGFISDSEDEEEEENNLLKIQQIPCPPPPLFDILNQLAQQVDEFRIKNNKFDLWLEERRKQLNLFNFDKQTSAIMGGNYDTLNLHNSPLQQQEHIDKQSQSTTSFIQRTLSLSYNQNTKDLSSVQQKQQNKPQRKFSFLEAISTPNPPPSPSMHHSFTQLFQNKELDVEFKNHTIFLDNVLILQECIKEILAAIQVRRGFGIDQVLFL
ncbi:hypothetical protein K502DRAFT_298817 [Neoconidiobolus thromboides FSU 785]|nr:hypothetical protein K502DRAFT_298817 [Neoconidiobolus thromboides FSU 785]